jgi:hypothetical protein
MHIQLIDAFALSGETVIGWSGREMAIGGGGCSINEHTEYTGEWESAPPIWYSDSVPYAQFLSIEFLLASGKWYQIQSLPINDDFFCSLIITEISAQTPPEPYTSGSIFRDVCPIGLPTGRASVISTLLNDTGSVLEIALSIDSHSVRLLSGEVYECKSDKFRIVERDESVLIQLDGARPMTYSCDEPSIF